MLCHRKRLGIMLAPSRRWPRARRIARCCLVGGRAAPASRRRLPLLDDSCGCSTPSRRLRNKAALRCSWQYDLLWSRSDRKPPAAASRRIYISQTTALRINRGEDAGKSLFASIASVLKPLANSRICSSLALLLRGTCLKGRRATNGYSATHRSYHRVSRTPHRSAAEPQSHAAT